MVTSAQWNAGSEDKKFYWLRAIGFSTHDAGIMTFHNWDKLPRCVQETLSEATSHDHYSDAPG
jgi:hypothetical protein